MEKNLTDILKILSTAIAYRKPEMIKILVNLTKGISFFINLINELGDKLHYLTCEYLSTEFYRSGSV